MDSSDSGMIAGNPGRRVWQARGYRLARFAMVGLGNTLVDAALFNLLTWRRLGVPLIAAAIVSGSVAMLASFLAHQRFTFRVQGTSLRKIIAFVVISAAGVYLARPLLMRWALSLSLGLAPWAMRNVAWLFAVSMVMGGNYLAYRRWVFAGGTPP